MMRPLDRSDGDRMYRILLYLLKDKGGKLEIGHSSGVFKDVQINETIEDGLIEGRYVLRLVNKTG